MSFLAGFCTENYIYSQVGIQRMLWTVNDSLERFKSTIVDSCAEHSVSGPGGVKGSESQKCVILSVDGHI